MKYLFSKIYWILFLLAFGALAFWGYKVFKKQYYNPPETASEQTVPQTSSNEQNPDVLYQNSTEDVPMLDNESVENKPEPENQTVSDQPQININDRNAPAGSKFANITTEHCNTGCQAFENDFQLLEYCQQVCGIIPIKQVSSCDGKEGLQKDYCLKDLAITKKDSSICDQIDDANIKQTCQNRIAEDIIENQ